MRGLWRGGVKGHCLNRTPLWQMVFGPAGAACLGSPRNCPRHAAGLAGRPPVSRRAVAVKKSEDLVAALAAYAHGVGKAKRLSPMMWPVGDAPGPDNLRQRAAFGAGPPGPPAARLTGDAS